MADISSGQFFYLADGKVLKSLQDLKEGLMQMPDSVFSTHVNDSRNDFASWVEGVFNDKELSEKIKAAKTREEMYSILSEEKKEETKRWDTPKRDETDIAMLVKKSIEETGISSKFDAIISQHKEIELREKKIQDIEQEIENRIQASRSLSIGFSLKSFILGIISGLTVGILTGFFYVLMF